MLHATRQATRHALQQRGDKAMQALRESLRLPTNLNDAELLRTAIAEAVASETLQNMRLASAIRRLYDELSSLHSPVRKRVYAQVEALPPLIPIRRDLPERPRDPFAPPDPSYLVLAYGSHQLARALHGYTVDMLKQTAARIEAGHPGTKPTNRGQRKSLIDYIVRYATQE